MDFTKVSNVEHSKTLYAILPMEDGRGFVEKTESLINGFSATIRLDVDNKNDALRWLANFQEKSRITFSVDKTFPENTQKIIFKKEYHCIHNTRPRKQFKPHEKHLNCNAKLTLTIKNKNMKRSQDAYLKNFPCEIFLRHNHSHPIYSSATLKFRPPSKNLQKEFTDLFEKGHSPSTALSMFKDKLFEETGDKYNEIVADGSKCPTQKWVYDLYYQIFKKEYGNPTGIEMLHSMEKAISEYNSKCNDICAVMDASENLVIAVCSPIMKRVHKYIRASAEVMFVDASGNMDRHNSRVFLFLCPSVVGALPLGIVMTYSESEKCITKGITLLKQILPKSPFYGQNFPKIIITDDCNAERNSLKYCFSDASVILCKFHVLQSVMRYLWNSANGVSKDDRVYIYQMFRRALNCANEEEFLDVYNFLLDQKCVVNNSKLKKYFVNLKKTSNVWAMCYRAELLTRGNETNNYAEATFRILKDKILLRQKAFSIVQLFDFLTSNFELFYFKKIIDIINGRWEGSKKKNKYYFKNDLISDLCCERLGENIYQVKSKDKIYVVNSEIETCTCFMGIKGAPCKHQFAVNIKFSLISQQFHPTLVNSSFKNLLHKVIFGADCKLEGWYAGLGEIVKNGNHTDSSDSYLKNNSESIFSECESVSSGFLKNNPAQETQSEIKFEDSSSLRIKLEGVVDLLIEKYENNIELYNKPITKFLENVASCKTDSSLISALHTFGKYNDGVPIIKKGKNCKGGRRITVQPTAIMRRKSRLGGRNVKSSGRPPKRLKLSDHAYSKVKGANKNLFEIVSSSKTASPHSLSYCVSNNVSLGKTNAKK